MQYQVGIVWGTQPPPAPEYCRSPFVAALLALYIGTPEQQTAILIYSGAWAIGGIFYNLLWWYASWKHRLLDRLSGYQWLCCYQVSLS